MKIFTVHELKNGKAEIVIIKEGFNCTAFILPPVWAIRSRFWLLGFVIIIVTIALYYVFINNNSDLLAFSTVYFALALALGFEANDIMRNDLLKRGFEEEKPMVAENADFAIYRHLLSFYSPATVSKASWNHFNDKS